jgi:hypothetical protein
MRSLIRNKMILLRISVVQKASIVRYLLPFALLLGGCSEVVGLAGLQNKVFEPEKEYKGRIETVGELSEAYIANTYALRKANNKLTTICLAARRCKEERLNGI